MGIKKQEPGNGQSWTNDPKCVPSPESTNKALQIIQGATKFNLRHMIAAALDDTKKQAILDYRGAQQRRMEGMMEDSIALEIKSKELRDHLEVAKKALEELSTLGGGRSDGNRIAQEALKNLTK